MLIKDFSAKLEAVRQYRAATVKRPATVSKALGQGYRVQLPMYEATQIFIIKGKEVERLLAEFPGVTELWKLFES